MSKDTKIVGKWCAYDMDENELVEQANNGNWVQSAAEVRVRETGNNVMVGYIVKLKDEGD